MLLIEVVDHRIRTQQELDSLSDEAIGWKITWAMKSIIEREAKQKVKDYRTNAVLGLGVVESEPAVFDDNDDEISMDQIEAQLDNLKLTPKTKQFIMDVLAHGKAQTMKSWNKTGKQFGRKINEVEKKCRKLGVRGKYEVAQWEHSLAKLYEIIDCIEDEDSIDSDIGNVISSDVGWWDDYVGQIAGIRNPVMLVEQFELGYRTDQYRFLNRVYQDRDVLAGKIGGVLK